MKKYLLIGSVLAILTLLTVVFAIPVLAHEPEDGETTSANQEAWEAMHEACEEGDWEAMAEAAEEAHGEDFDGMPYHDGDYTSANHMGGMGSHMGGNIMGWY
jgi:hypothetical protein